MTTKHEILPAGLVEHARRRGGVFTTTVAEGTFGVRGFRDAIERNECHRIRPGLYSLTPELDTNAKVWAGLQMGGSAATLGLAAADWVRGQGPEPEFIDVWVGARNLADRGPWRFHSGIPDDLQSSQAVNEAFGRLLVTRDPDKDLALKLAGRALKLEDRERFLWLCEDGNATDGQSAFETRLNNEVLLPHGLPILEWESVPDGKPHEVRALLAGMTVGIQFDGSLPRENGYLFSPPGYSRFSPNADATDTSAPLVLGWSDIEDRACRTAGSVARRLRAKGWQGELMECKRCAPPKARYGYSDYAEYAEYRNSTECPSCGSQLVQLWRRPQLEPDPEPVAASYLRSVW